MGVSKVDSSKRRQEMRFTLPRDIYHGENALEALKTFKGKKAFVCVGGGSMKRFGFLDRVVQYLQEAGMEVKLYEGIESDPSVETVMKGAKAMEEFGLPIVEDLFAHGKITYEMGYRLTKKVLDKQVDFSAIFAFSDEMAMGAIRALQESGIQVPEDVSVLGFDDISFSEKYNPPLTTIHQPIQEFVTQSLNFFLEKEERNKNVDIIFPFRIIERSSCQENRQK